MSVAPGEGDGERWRRGWGEKERREDILGKGCGKGTVGKGRGGGGGSGRVSTGQGSLTHGV